MAAEEDVQATGSIEPEGFSTHHEGDRWFRVWQDSLDQHVEPRYVMIVGDVQKELS